MINNSAGKKIQTVRLTILFFATNKFAEKNGERESRY